MKRRRDRQSFDLSGGPAGRGAGQRQLRVGEEIRHALSKILHAGECRDPALSEASITVVSRDLMIISAIIVSRLMEKPLPIKPMFVSKVNTGVQIAFAVLVMSTQAFTLDVPRLYATGMILVTALTVVSAAAYLARWMRHMANGAT